MNRKIIKSFINKNYVEFTDFEKSSKNCTDMEMKKCQNTRKDN